MFDRGIEYKTPEQIELMRAAGLVVARTLDLLKRSISPGITTGELDTIAKNYILSQGATSNFLGYHGFTGVICASVNDEVVHGIPGRRALAEGDLLSIDCGAIVDGWHADAAVTIVVGEASAADAELMRVTEESLQRGIAAAQPGARVGDVSHAIASYVRSQGDYGIVEGFTGHGIGTELHQEPDVPNVGKAGRGPKLKPGVVIAIEPMINAGGAEVTIQADGWTVTTNDGSRSAHFEHTVAITETGPVVLTQLP